MPDSGQPRTLNYLDPSSVLFVVNTQRARVHRVVYGTCVTGTSNFVTRDLEYGTPFTLQWLHKGPP
jgi:hypothetical protein